MKTSLLSVISLLLTASLLQGGVIMEMTTQELPSKKEVQTTTIRAQDGKARVDSGKDSSMIFSNNVMWMLSHDKKTMMKMDQQSLERLAEQMNSIAKQMEEQLAKLPPEQREMMEKMMKGAMTDQMKQKSFQIRFEPAGSGKWQQYNCKKYNVYRNEEKTEEICAASPDQLQGAGEAMEAFIALGAFSRKMVESLQKGPLGEMMGGALSNPLQGLDQMEGVPVHTIHLENGKPVREESLKTFSQQSLDASTFTPPSDYKLQDPFKQQQ